MSRIPLSVASLVSSFKEVEYRIIMHFTLSVSLVIVSFIHDNNGSQADFTLTHLLCLLKRGQAQMGYKGVIYRGFGAIRCVL